MRRSWLAAIASRTWPSRIDATGLQAAEFGSSGDLEVGDSVMAIGNPGGWN